jgi:hypothetical protein
MPKSSGAPPDHDMGAIEAVVKETARGRAFLAYYARKMRQSDTLTMLAMIGRIERWCHDQAARLTELEGNDLVFGNRAPEGDANLALGLNGESSGGHRDMSLHANQDLASAERANEEAECEIASVRNGREAVDCIEHLANTLRDFDRGTADLTSRYSATGQFTYIGPSTLVASVDAGMGTMMAHPAASDARKQFSPHTADKTHRSEEDILDDIAKALGTAQ